jgi:hypothetical protein
MAIFNKREHEQRRDEYIQHYKHTVRSFKLARRLNIKKHMTLYGLQTLWIGMDLVSEYGMSEDAVDAIYDAVTLPADGE